MSLKHQLPGFRLPVRDPYGYDCLNNYALQGHIIFRKLSNCRKITSCRRNCIFSFWEKGGSASRRKNQGWCLDCLAITATESGWLWSKQTAFSVSDPGSSRQRCRKETQDSMYHLLRLRNETGGEPGCGHHSRGYCSMVYSGPRSKGCAFTAQIV